MAGKKGNSILEQLRAKAQTGLESGTWFSPIKENIGVEIVGVVGRIFKYEYAGENRVAATLRLMEPATFVIAKAGETDTVNVAEGEQVLVGISGQLAHLFAVNGVAPGTIVYLKYEGKDEKKVIRGNHPHTWTYAFQNPDTGETS